MCVPGLAVQMLSRQPPDVGAGFAAGQKQIVLDRGSDEAVFLGDFPACLHVEYQIRFGQFAGSSTCPLKKPATIATGSERAGKPFDRLLPQRPFSPDLPDGQLRIEVRDESTLPLADGPRSGGTASDVSVGSSAIASGRKKARCVRDAVTTCFACGSSVSQSDQRNAPCLTVVSTSPPGPNDTS